MFSQISGIKCSPDYTYGITVAAVQNHASSVTVKNNSIFQIAVSKYILKNLSDQKGQGP